MCSEKSESKAEEDEGKGKANFELHWLYLG